MCTYTVQIENFVIVEIRKLHAAHIAYDALQVYNW